MTTRKPNDARDLADPRFDAAWRAASSEEPPPALDDAIRAAARREAGAGPRPADTPAPHVPEALRPERWWWPLAAAATIGAVAIGLLQLATPENVGLPGSDTAVVSDMPAAPQLAQRKSEAAAVPRAEAPGRTAKENAAAAAGTPALPSGLSGARPRAGTDAATAPPPTAALRKDAPAPAAAEERAAVPAETRASGERKKQAGTAMPAPAPLAEPFPADAAKPDASEAVAGAPPSPPKTAATSEAGTVSGKLAETPATTGPTLRAQEPPRAAPPAAPASAPPPAASPEAAAQDSITAAPPPAAARAPSFAPEQQTRAGGGVGSLASAPAAQSAAAKSERRAKESDHAKLPVAEWVALIRKLIDEGRVDDAAKELALFRAAHPDHARLLPPDLRDWRPPATR